jgi:competence protein ComEC
MVSPDRPPHSLRAPFVILALAAAAGIAIDRAIPLPPAILWPVTLIAAAIVLVQKGLAAHPKNQQRSVWSLTFVVIATAGLFATRHHQYWWQVPLNDASRFATSEGRLISLAGEVVELPTYRETRSPNPNVPDAQWRTSVIIAATAIDTGQGWQPATGLVRLTTAGRLPGRYVGRQITTIGWLALPEPPANPGEFDFRHWLWSRGVRSILRIDQVEAITFAHQSSDQWPENLLGDWHPRLLLIRLRAGLREQASQVFHQQMPKREATVAEALVLGSRSQLEPELRDEFIASGTLHLLAISGLNIGIVWQLLWVIARAAGASRKTALLVISIGLVGYCWLVESNPPVVRATVVALALAGAGLSYRPVSSWNSLAFAVVVLLWLNPSDLFQTGAQLSVLSVMVLLRFANWDSVAEATDTDGSVTETGVAPPVPSPSPALAELSQSLLKAVKQTLLVSFCIWAITSPIIAAQSYLISPIGIIANVLVAPLVLLALWLGYAYLCLVLTIPILGWPVAFLLKSLLALTLSIIQIAAHLPGSLISVPPLPTWWLVGFGLIALSGLLVPSLLKRRTGFMYLVGLWVLCWCLVAAWPPVIGRLRLTTLAVGHGLAVLVEFPNGQTLLYDAGSLGQPERAAETVFRAVRALGHERLDAVIISHADADHCNGIPDLARKLPIGCVIISPHFLDLSQPEVARVASALARYRIPCKAIGSGERLSIDPQVDCDILHPARTFQPERDNAASIVLRLNYRGQRLMLTGDLERNGLKTLLAMPRQPCEVLVVPHHGGRTSNPPAFAAWTGCAYAISSQGKQDSLQHVKATYGDQATIFVTSQDGAIICEVPSDGGFVTVKNWRENRWSD